MSQIENALKEHRPYGLDCKCGRPINSDADWARHASDVVSDALRGMTQQWGVKRRRGDHPVARESEAWCRDRVAFLRARYGDDEAAVVKRLATGWFEDDEDAELIALAEQRLANDTGRRTSLEDARLELIGQWDDWGNPLDDAAEAYEAKGSPAD